MFIKPTASRAAGIFIGTICFVFIVKFMMLVFAGLVFIITIIKHY